MFYFRELGFSRQLGEGAICHRWAFVQAKEKGPEGEETGEQRGEWSSSTFAGGLSFLSSPILWAKFKEASETEVDIALTFSFLII